MNKYKSWKKGIIYLVVLSMVVVGAVPTSFVKAEEEDTLKIMRFNMMLNLKKLQFQVRYPRQKIILFDNCSELVTMTIKNPNIELAKRFTADGLR